MGLPAQGLDFFADAFNALYFVCLGCALEFSSFRDPVSYTHLTLPTIYSV